MQNKSQYNAKPSAHPNARNSRSSVSADRPRSKQPMSQSNKRQQLTTKSTSTKRPSVRNNRKPSPKASNRQTQRKSGSQKGTFALSFRQIKYIVIIIAALILAFGIFDFASNWGKIYRGVSTGGVDLSGLTAQEAKTKIHEHYDMAVSDFPIYVAADNTIQNQIDSLKSTPEDLQPFIDQAIADKTLWVADPTVLDAQIDSETISKLALEVGRENGGLGKRISSFFMGTNIEPLCSFNPESLDLLMNDINASLGVPRVENNVAFQDGLAVAIEGSDGIILDPDDFSSALSQTLIHGAEHANMLAILEPASVLISKDQANELCVLANKCLEAGANLSFQGKEIFMDRQSIAPMLVTKIVDDGDAHVLKLDIDKNAYSAYVRENLRGNIQTSFEKTDDGVFVNINDPSQLSDNAADSARFIQELFYNDKRSSSPQLQTTPLEFALSSMNKDKRLSLNDALEAGYIEEIATYTTEYTEYPEERNFNIHRVSDFLDLSIVAPNQEWSFNKIAGNCNEENGFKSAGIILDGEYTKESGGGICQVSTTIFNAVLEAGLPISERNAHTLHMLTYADGRDAAVTFPTMDLRWDNNSESDLILDMSYDATTVTAKIFGQPLFRTVDISVDDWVEGREFDTIYYVDKELKEGEQEVVTEGENAKSITLNRSVSDRFGNLLYNGSFISTYEPIDEEIIVFKAPEDAKIIKPIGDLKREE